MKINFLLLIFIILSISCQTEKSKESRLTDKVHISSSEIYELHKVDHSNSVLVLFPGGAATSKEIKEEFDILPIATDNNISVLLMNFNRHLWIDENQTKELAEKLDSIFIKTELDKTNVFFGGMSIGGNVVLSLSNHLNKNKYSIKPKGVFIVDSPIDLYALYESSITDTKNKALTEERLEEPKMIINYFERKFGVDSVLINIQKVSPFTMKTGWNNVQNLKDIKLRFYTEPDSLWWIENRQTDFENTNAYAIQQISNYLEKVGWNQAELIETKNKGYRSNGERHPHSWSIVNIDGLLHWIKE